MKTPSLHSQDSPLVLYSAHDASLAVIRMHHARQIRRKSAADFENERRRQLGIKPLPPRKGLINRLLTILHSAI